MREAVEEARRAITEAIDEAKSAKEEAEAAREEAEDAVREATGVRKRVRTTRLGDPLPELAFLWIMASLIIKVTYKKQIQAEAQAAQATETAEAESLKRQVVEARMAAMQAQVEPHFLFNTLASIDHLIETDPARASTMQKNLIALLRASMPTMREARRRRPARPESRAGDDQAVPRDPEGAHGRPAAHRDRRARRPAVGRIPVDDDPDAWWRTPSSTAWSPSPKAAG